MMGKAGRRRGMEETDGKRREGEGRKGWFPNF